MRRDKNDQEGVNPLDDPINSQSKADVVVDYSELIEKDAFISDTPFEVILEEITEQFNEYIDMENRNNHVEDFYQALHLSYEQANADDEAHPAELKEALDRIHDRFVSKMAELFEQRLTLSIMGLEAEETDDNDVEFVIKRLYEFFILGARSNFKVVIANDILRRLPKDIQDDTQYFKMIEDMLWGFTPLVTALGPMEFLKARGDDEIIMLFENGKVVGNFLRKYSPKLYQHEEFQVELVNHITMISQFGEELNNGGQ